MFFEILLIGFAIYFLVWKKLPTWGSWFNWTIERLPQILQKLYKARACAQGDQAPQHLQLAGVSLMGQRASRP